MYKKHLGFFASINDIQLIANRSQKIYVGYDIEKIRGTFFNCINPAQNPHEYSLFNFSKKSFVSLIQIFLNPHPTPAPLRGADPPYPQHAYACTGGQEGVK